MQIVINISDIVYSQIKAGLSVQIPSKFVLTVLDAVNNGIPLPKGHGRLIDEKDVINIYDIDDKVWWENALYDIREFIPTIIEADKIESEEMKNENIK